MFHCYQQHGLMKMAFEDCIENTNNIETKQKFQELMAALGRPDQEEVGFIFHSYFLIFSDSSKAFYLTFTFSFFLIPGKVGGHREPWS